MIRANGTNDAFLYQALNIVVYGNDFLDEEKEGNMSRYLPVLLISVILGGHLVSAQVTTGTISGVVQDSSGAVIPGVSVTVQNLGKATARTVTTDEGGRYNASKLNLVN